MRRLLLLLLILPGAGCGSALADDMSLPQADFVPVDKSDRVLTLFANGKPTRNYHGLQPGDAPEGYKQFEGDERTPGGALHDRHPQSG